MEAELPKLPNYELVRRIGRGGFGDVYLAKSAGGGFAAVKIIPSENAKREASALKKRAALQRSENLVKILASGEIGGAVYYAMPLADSLESRFDFPPTDFRWQEKSLAKLIDRKLEPAEGGWFTREEILSFMLPVFDAAIELGENGMLHRDIKPDNILFFGGKAALSDFSLLERDRRSLSNAGTPLYLAPSWYVNKGGNPDAYGLATTFYTLITGNLPDAIGRPAYRFPEKIADTISAEDKEQWLHWHRCIMRAIAENPSERFLTLEDFRAAIVSQDFASSRNFPKADAASPKPRRAKRYYAAAAIALAAGIGSLVYLPERGAQNPPVAAGEPSFDENLFRQIRDNGFSDKQLGFSIYSRARWLENKREFYKRYEAAYKADLRLSKKTRKEAEEEVIGEYREDFRRHFKIKAEDMEGASGAFEAYLKANSRMFGEKIKMKLANIAGAKARADSSLEAMMITKEQIENPEAYRQYAVGEYKSYQKKKDFLLKNK